MADLRFDIGASLGTNNRSRSDVQVGDTVTVNALSAVGTVSIDLLDKPSGSAAALAGSGSTRTINPDSAGSYRIRVSDDAGVRIHTFTVLTARLRLHIPAHNERANPDANEVDTDPGTWVDDSETNEGGSFKGWHPAMERNFRFIEAFAAGETADRTIYVDGTVVATGDGSNGSPYKTAAEAEAAATLSINLGVTIKIRFKNPHPTGDYEVTPIHPGGLGTLQYEADPSTYVEEAAVQTAATTNVGATYVTVAGTPYVANAHRYHHVEWLTGTAAGRVQKIMSNTDSTLHLAAEISTVSASPGDTFRIVSTGVSVTAAGGSGSLYVRGGAHPSAVLMLSGLSTSDNTFFYGACQLAFFETDGLLYCWSGTFRLAGDNTIGLGAGVHAKRITLNSQARVNQFIATVYYGSAGLLTYDGSTVDGGYLGLYGYGQMYGGRIKLYGYWSNTVLYQLDGSRFSVNSAMDAQTNSATVPPFQPAEGSTLELLMQYAAGNAESPAIVKNVGTGPSLVVKSGAFVMLGSNLLTVGEVGRGTGAADIEVDGLTVDSDHFNAAGASVEGETFARIVEVA